MISVQQYLRDDKTQPWEEFISNQVDHFIAKFGYPPEFIETGMEVKIKAISINRFRIPVLRIRAIATGHINLCPAVTKRTPVIFEGKRTSA